MTPHQQHPRQTPQALHHPPGYYHTSLPSYAQARYSCVCLPPFFPTGGSVLYMAPLPCLDPCTTQAYTAYQHFDIPSPPHQIPPPNLRCRFHQRFSFASMRLVTSACSPSTRGRPQPPSTESTTAGAHTTLHTSHMHSHAHPHPHTPTYAPTYIRMSTTPITPTMPLCLQAHLSLIRAPF